MRDVFTHLYGYTVIRSEENLIFLYTYYLENKETQKSVLPIKKIGITD